MMLKKLSRRWRFSETGISIPRAPRIAHTEVARLLGLAPETVRRQILDLGLDALPPSRHWMLMESEIEKIVVRRQGRPKKEEKKK